MNGTVGGVEVKYNDRKERAQEWICEVIAGEIIIIAHEVHKINSSCTCPVPPGQVLPPLTAPMALQAARLPL